MGKYGVRICNIEASTLYEYDMGLREKYSYKKAMFTNSLLCDFLQDNGLKMYGKESTRDIIALEFNFGTRSYKEEYKHLRKLSKEAKFEKDKEKRLRILQLRKNAFKKRHLYKKISKEEIRNYYYTNGFGITYTSLNKCGEIKKQDTIHYKMLFRSTGKAKKGTCMFINDRLYNKTYKFLTMGIKIPKHNTPIVELSAYMPLVSSTIVGKVKINPKNILILNDVDSFFKTKVVSVETDDKKHCVAKTIDDYTVKNTMFDGQALIDNSIFPEWGNGYILLRHHFCKMAAFNTNIQLFFQDYFGIEYLNAKIVDMFGNEHYAKDIELITTNNAMKWLKFDVSYDYWCGKVYENDCMFGIVKTAHESKLGDVQRMSYQMVNTLGINDINTIAQKSVDYIEKLKTDDDVFLDYLRRNDNFANDYRVLIALVEQNREFLRSEYFRSRKSRIIRLYVDDFKRGRIIQKADNLTMVGSPYAMLLHSVGEDVEKDISFTTESQSIQCYANGFKNGEYLAGFRSPHNSCNNTIPLHNVYTKVMQKYFNLGKLVIAVNVQHTDIQDRANGCDFDSDMIYCTNQNDIVRHVQECYSKYPTIVNNISKEKQSYDNILEHYANVDNNISASRITIGESSNLAQIALSYTYNFEDTKYADYVCILSVLAQVAIDNAKRRYDIDLVKEVKRIKKDMNIKYNGYPKFWKLIKSKFNKKNINYELDCPMNRLGDIKINEFKPTQSTLSMDYFFYKHKLSDTRRKCKRVEKFIEKYSLELYSYSQSKDNDNNDDYLLLKANFNDMINDIQKIYISNNYLGLMSWLIDRAFCITSYQEAKHKDDIWNKTKSQSEQNKSILLKVLYDINPKGLLKIFSKNI